MGMSELLLMNCRIWWQGSVSNANCIPFGRPHADSSLEEDVRTHRTLRSNFDSEYTDAGRLACIFLDDFLGR